MTKGPVVNSIGPCPDQLGSAHWVAIGTAGTKCWNTRMTYRFTATIACGFDDPDQNDCLMAGRMREVLRRILAYGRPDARPRLVEL
ncbi:hypothetical protein ABZZ47_08930 [Streptomyces sp. NPDC006465]|uniref:hypothetical protein n=1 Tax=Streptomyces sp. NPDC006465 TaxID=3157174 RepID=UPI0033B43448